MTSYRKTPPPRHDLPNRRLTETIKMKSPEGHSIFLSVGFDPQETSRPREVFYASGFRSGSALEFQLQDSCVLISLLLQHGLKPHQIAKSLARDEQPDGDMAYASLTGLIVEELINATAAP